MTDSTATPYWIDNGGLARALDGSPPRCAIVACPPGGSQLESGIASLRAQGIESLVSLLSAEEAKLLGLDEEARLCREAGIEFLWLPIADHSIPESLPEFRAAVERLHGDLRAGKGVGAHCFAGIGRSCMLMACVLCLEGLTADEAFSRLSEARGLRVPDTWLQSRWVHHFADSLAKEREPL